MVKWRRGPLRVFRGFWAAGILLFIRFADAALELLPILGPGPSDRCRSFWFGLIISTVVSGIADRRVHAASVPPPPN